jgi:DnaJ-class molecular chaperone
VEHPKVKLKQVSTMALGMGCTNFFGRTYHKDTLYDVLGVQPDVSVDVIKSAYLTRAKELHPDVNDREDATIIMSKVTEAFELLSNVEKRKIYDRCTVSDLMLNEREEDHFSSVVNKSA